MKELTDCIHVLTRYGEMDVPIGDQIVGRSLELYGEWAQDEINVLRSFIKQGDTVVDIGACFGSHSLSFAEAVGPSGHVLAIEGSSANFAYLECNCRRNAGGNARARLGVVAADRKVVFAEAHDDANSGGARFAVAPMSSDNTVETITVDDIDLKRVDFIKIDVEDMESDVLRGASTTLTDHRPTIFFEVNNLEYGIRACRVAAGHDYELYGVLSAAYRENNFRAHHVNIFGSGMECGILGIPKEETIRRVDALGRLPKIITADDLSILLLHKPQYLLNDISLSATTKFLGMPRGLDPENTLLAEENYRLSEALAEEGRRLNVLIDENNRLRKLLVQAKVLATRAGEFPFNFYFRGRGKYLALIKAIRSAPMLAGDDEVPSEEHAGGYKALHLKNLKPLVMPEKAVDLVPDYHQGDVQLGLQELQALLARLGKGKTLYIAFSHDDYRTISGGLQLAVGIEAQEAIARGDLYLHAHPTTVLQTLAPADMGGRPCLRLTLNNQPLGLVGCQLLADVLRNFRDCKSRVIVHQLLGHAPERINEIISLTTEKPVYWLHDYFSLCTSPQLLRNEVTFCGAPDVRSNACQICSHGPTRFAHRARIDMFLTANHFLFLAPSRVVADIFKAKVILPACDLQIVPHMSVQFEEIPDGIIKPQPHINIAFVGNPGIHKGWPLFEENAKRYASDPRFKFFYFGNRDVSKFMTFVGVHVTAQNRNAMIDSIRTNNIDLVVHMPPWPETFSFTTQEALAAGAYVITQKVSGNTATLVADSGRGIILEDAKSYQELFENGKIVELGREARRRRANEKTSVTFSKQFFETLTNRTLS